MIHGRKVCNSMNEQQLHTLFDMTGKVAIVTGGHAWLGNDIACALA